MDGKRWFSKTRLAVLLIGVGIVFFSPVGTATAAYHHMGEIDSGHFLSVFPDKAGTKLDSCNLCHSGGSYRPRREDGQPRKLSVVPLQVRTSKQSTPANLEATLNPYGLDYLLAGRSAPPSRRLPAWIPMVTAISMPTRSRRFGTPGTRRTTQPRCRRRIACSLASNSSRNRNTASSC